MRRISARVLLRTGGAVSFVVLATAAGASPSARLAAVPARFEKNLGQGGRAALYLGRGAGGIVSITRRGFVLTVGSRDGSIQRARRAAVEVQMVGANPKAEVVASEPLKGVTNYLRGRDPSRWVTGVPMFGRVRQRGVYPGVDIEHYGIGTRLEHDYVVAPGANPRTIAFRVRGATLSLLPDGSLSAKTPAGALQFGKPVAYQDSPGRRTPVAVAYALRPNGDVGFRTARYDHSRTLVIDPVVLYATYLGGTSVDWAVDVCLDANGAAYVTGYACTDNFPTTAGAWDTAVGGTDDAFVTKIAPDGQTLVYSTFIGGNSSDSGAGIAVDPSGSAYIIGGTTSGDLPTTAGAAQPVFPCSYQASFVAKLDATGSSLLYCTYFGASSHCWPGDIAVDTGGNAYICGSGYDAPVTAGAAQTVALGNQEGWVAKVNPAGSGYSYCTLLSGHDNDICTAIALHEGVAYVTGYTGGGSNGDYPTTQGAFDPTFNEPTSAFVTAVSPTGTSIVYSTFIGVGLGYGITTDAAGAVYACGQALSPTFPITPGAYMGTFTYGEAYVVKLNAAGSELDYATFVAPGIAMDVDLWDGRACVTGRADDGMPTTPGTTQAAYGGGIDAFAVVLNATGTAAEFASYMGGAERDEGYGIASAGGGRLVVVGFTASANFWSHRALQPANAQSPNDDAFVVSLDVLGTKSATTTWATDRSGTISTLVTLRGYLRRSTDSTWLDGKPIGFRVDGTYVGTAITGATGSSGRADLNWTITEGPASRAISAEFAGDPAYTPSSGSATLTCQSWTTKMAAFNRTGRITDRTELKARLLRSDNAPLFGKSINFYVDGTFIITRNTNVDGYASYPNYDIPDGAGAGVRTILSEWQGNGGFAAVSKTANLTVLKAIPYIWVLSKSVASGGVANLYAYFRRLYDYKKQEGKPVTFRIDGTWIADATTGSGASEPGVARYLHPTTGLGLGVHKVRCEFAGDAWVDAGYGEGNLTIL